MFDWYKGSIQIASILRDVAHGYAIYPNVTLFISSFFLEITATNTLLTVADKVIIYP